MDIQIDDNVLTFTAPSSDSFSCQVTESPDIKDALIGTLGNEKRNLYTEN